MEKVRDMDKDTRSKVKQLARQIKNNPGDSFSKFALALEFRKQGEYKNARILFEDIRDKDPDYVGVYYHLGKLYEMFDRLPEAKKMYEQGIPIADFLNKKRTESELREALHNVEIEMDQQAP
ncbi:MAG TPA: tetratricopeptide repeat protein [Fodinibius sp.]|nr:tetratricopeptide repeat protein [Fodinibius sp.]